MKKNQVVKTADAAGFGILCSACAISQNALPQRFVRLVDRYGDTPVAMRQAGIAYATQQIIDLYANGVNAVHVYSMNNPIVAKSIKDNLSEIIK